MEKCGAGDPVWHEEGPDVRAEDWVPGHGARGEWAGQGPDPGLWHQSGRRVCA